MRRRITRGDIAKALQDGDITIQDLLAVIEGYAPKRRGPKANLIRQARVLGVLEILKAEMSESKAKDVIMAAGKGLSSTSAFDRLLDRARSNWTALPPFERALDDAGKTVRAVMLYSKSDGSSLTIVTRLSDWGL